MWLAKIYQCNELYGINSMSYMRQIWNIESLNDCNGYRTHTHLVHKQTLKRFGQILGSWDIRILVISLLPAKSCVNRLIMSWNSLHKLPIVIFEIIQKPLWIKTSKRPGDESINKNSEHIWQPITSSSSLVFHNTFAGQSFCKHIHNS